MRLAGVSSGCWAQAIASPSSQSRRPVDVAGRVDAVAERRAAGRDVLEEVPRDHVVGVALRRARQLSRSRARRAELRAVRSASITQSSAARRSGGESAVTRSSSCGHSAAVATAGARARRKRTAASAGPSASLRLMGPRAAPSGRRADNRSPDGHRGPPYGGTGRAGGVRQPVAARCVRAAAARGRMLKGRARGRRRRPHQGPPGGPQRTPARRRDPRRRPAAHPGRRRLGQDAGAHPPDRVARADRARARRRAPGHHLHQQGRAGDARARRAAARALDARHVGHDLPRGVRAAAARRGAAPGLHPPVHDLRRGRLPPPGQALHRRARHRPQALHARRRCSTRSPTRRTSCATPRPTASRSDRSSRDRRRGLRALRARPARA